MGIDCHAEVVASSSRRGLRLVIGDGRFSFFSWKIVPTKSTVN